MKKKSNILRSVVAIVISLFHLIPFYILITTALKPMTDLSSRWIFPKEIHLENFTYALEKGGLITAMYNSIIITVISVLIIALIGATTAYPLARIKTKTNSVVLNLVVAVMMIPPLSMLVPLYSLLTKIGAINTYWGIIVITVTMGLPLSIFLYSNFISTIPVDLEEAASIDGCSRFKAFYKVVLPLLKPVTATVVILTGVNVWNDFQFPIYITGTGDENFNISCIIIFLSKHIKLKCSSGVSFNSYNTCSYNIFTTTKTICSRYGR